MGTRHKQQRQRFNSQLFSLASLPWKTHRPNLGAPWDQLPADPQHFIPPAPASISLHPNLSPDPRLSFIPSLNPYPGLTSNPWLNLDPRLSFHPSLNHRPLGFQAPLEAFQGKGPVGEGMARP